ncbi:hypothetical protein [Streptomyces similanensis]|uniref:Secreted protein n=1 Tax=Streptomyces similanensis TaxID=1274988 RepID=A0ABP9JZP4_9ACTN
MRKIITCGLLAAAVLSAVTPASAADDDGDLGRGVDAPDTWNFTAADVCVQELAVVPALSDWTGNHKNNCSESHT